VKDALVLALEVVAERGDFFDCSHEILGALGLLLRGLLSLTGGSAGLTGGGGDLLRSRRDFAISADDKDQVVLYDLKIIGRQFVLFDLRSGRDRNAFQIAAHDDDLILEGFHEVNARQIASRTKRHNLCAPLITRTFL